MNKIKKINKIRERRKNRARVKILGTASKPRLSVFRSNRYSFVQLIDDEKGLTLVSVSTKKLSKTKEQKNSKISLSEKLGESIAKKAIEKGIKRAVFDRGAYKYHGRVKAVADGARSAGLKI